MKSSILLALVVAIIATNVHSSDLRQGSLLRSHHRMIKKVVPSNDNVSTLERRAEGKKCGSDKWESNSDWSHKKHHHKHHHHKTHHKHHHKHHHKNNDNKDEQNNDKSNDHESAKSGDDSNQQQQSPKQKQPKEHKEGKGQSNGTSGSNSGGGLAGVTFPGQCPNPKATDEHPNGCIQFLNCNIDNGWKPPHVEMNQLKIASPDEVVKGDVFKPCGKYLDDFKSISEQSNIPATILMSIAMQESHCDAGLTGPNGEVGIMQIIPENCKGNCWDVRNNIHLGASELQDELKNSGGNFLQAMGEVSPLVMGIF